MPKSDFKSVDDYIAAQPKPMQSLLRRLRSTIRKAVPEAEEVISYKMPAYKLHGRSLLYFAAWTEHYALYPGTGRLTATLKEELARYELSKGTIRFPISQPVPVKLIERIAKFRAQENTDRSKAKLARPKKRVARGTK